MNREERLKIFETELEYIKDSKIREFTEKALEELPQYFFEVAASSTGKFHPSYALGEGGLVRHTKAAVRIAIELFRMDCFKYTEIDKDMIIASLILHDGCKSGLNHSKYTVTEHPLIVADFIEQSNDIVNIIDPELLKIITSNIKSHMGQWCFDYKSKKEVLPKPNTKMQRFVHLCDYLASRKCLDFNFDVTINRE